MEKNEENDDDNGTMKSLRMMMGAKHERDTRKIQKRHERNTKEIREKHKRDTREPQKRHEGHV